ncbi:MAG: hypothetical protein MK212_12600 [Saprospiraceae bacterium]|nr:hypothetical protein [Saprospiraceae bacterium]
MEEHAPEEQYQPSEEMLKRVLLLPCPSCGSQFTYSAKKQLLVCDHCGDTEDFSKANDKVRELSLEEGIRKAESYNPTAAGKKALKCDSCGSHLIVPADQPSVRCDFCGSERINEVAFDRNIIKPQGIIPFKIPKQEAIEKFRTWIKKGWFHPNKLKRLAALGDVHGIYVPFWTYDAKTHSDWSGQAGYYYYETQTYTSNGETKTRQVRKTRWVRRSGSFSRDFDDVLIVASKGLPHEIITKIYPFSLKETINYDPQLMLGWDCEVYSIEVDEGYKIADDKMDSMLRQQASSALGGDTQRFLRVHSQKWGQTFKHIILPVWLCTYMYNNKSYQFAVNGQTGTINGKKPLSWVKITLAILVVVAIIATIVILANN